jgi:hypothetical protein
MSDGFIITSAPTKAEYVSYAFIITGLLTILITSYNFTEGAVNGTIAGYSTLLAGVLILSNINKSSAPNSFEYYLPVCLLVGTIIFNLVTVSQHFKEIIKESIPSYGTFMFVSTILTFTQIYLLFMSRRGKFNLRLATLMGLINLISAITLSTILKYYPTDC